MMNKLLSAFAVVVLLAPVGVTPAGAQQGSQDLDDRLPVDPAVTIDTLANGLRYYIRTNSEPRARAELRLIVKAGSILEDDDQQGLAHFVEHMAFNGTEHFEKQEMVDYLESIGMQFGPEINAYTSFDETVYMLTVPTDSAELIATAFKILEDWAHGLTFDHEEIDKERGVVIEEWRLGQGAAARLREKQFPILFKDSRYAVRLPIGKPEILENFNYETLTRFYHDWYRPDLMAVIAVGDFEPDTIEHLIHQHFDGLEPPASPRERTVYPVPDHKETLFAIATDPEMTFNSVNVYWKQDLRDENSYRAYRQSVVESLFNQMLNQRLFELTQQADPPFLGAFSGQGRFIGAKEVYILGAGAPDNGIERALTATMTEAERVARFGFTETELEREKRELLRSLEQAYAEREKTESSAYASEYTRSFLWDEPTPGIANEFELTKRFAPGITLEEVNSLARKWIVDQNRVILVSAPEKDSNSVPTEDDLSAAFAAVAATEMTAYEDLTSDAPLVARIPEPAAIVERETIDEVGIQRWKLANGVHVILKPTDFKDDEIVFRAWSPGGSSLATDEDYIAAVTAVTAVTAGGAGDFSLVDLQKALAGKVVRVSPYVSSLTEGLSGSASPRDVETMFQLIYLYFTAPRRDEEAYQSLTTRIQAFVANRSADPIAAYQDTIQVTMAQDNFRARPASAELYSEMDLDRSLAFYRDRFADASDFTFVFVGTFDPDSLAPLIQSYLGGLPSTGRVEGWRDEGIEPPSGVIHKQVYRGIEPKSQTQIMFTGPFEWTRENRYAMASLASVLRIRLREVLREDMGGTYGVGVSGRPSRDPKPEYQFNITFGTAPDRLEEMTQAVFLQIDSLQRYGPSQVDVDKVKETQRRQRETNLRENSYWLGQLVAASLYGMDPREILTYERMVDALDIETVQAAAREYLNTENYVQVSLYPESGAEPPQQE